MAHSPVPTSTGSLASSTPNVSRTPCLTSLARASRLAAVASPGLTRASVCLNEMRAPAVPVPAVPALAVPVPAAVDANEMLVGLVCSAYRVLHEGGRPVDDDPPFEPDGPGETDARPRCL